MKMILVDGLPSAVVQADDRGLAYGDGVFRTLAMRNGIAELWPRHYVKLAADCRALEITPPQEADLQRDLAQVATHARDCALRITVTRGSGGHGYALPNTVKPRRVVTVSPLPQYPGSPAVQGVRLRYCDMRLALQPRLAGIKHLNRLENVLARAEWNDPAIAEGLLLDTADRVIEGSRSNLFLVEGQGLATPDLSQCGVAGITRDLVIEAAQKNGMQCEVTTVSTARLEAAHEIFLVNSLIGVWPVAALGWRRWTDFAVSARVRKWLDACRNPSH
ncbi:MAG: aminodeoxychorismate lyase [Burkholderiales bacterium]